MFEFGNNPYLVFGHSNSGRTTFARKSVLEHPDVMNIFFNSTWKFVKAMMDSNENRRAIWILDDFIATDKDMEEVKEAMAYNDRLMIIMVSDIYTWYKIYRKINPLELICLEPKMKGIIKKEFNVLYAENEEVSV